MRQSTRSIKVGIYTVGSLGLPSTRFRVLQYLPEFKKAGFEVCCFSLPPLKGGKIQQFFLMLWQACIRWQQLGKARHYDLLVIQKGLTFWRCRGLVQRLLSTKVPYMMDIDDAIYALIPVLFPLYFRWLQEPDEPLPLFKQAEQIVAGNRFLAEFVRRFGRPTEIIPTPIDTDLYRPVARKTKDKLTIGWSGSTGTNFYFNDLIDVFNALSCQYDFELLIISNDLKNIELRKLEKIKPRFKVWSPETEVQGLQEIDIGVMPLKEDPWSKGKSGLKALQYMALGIPTICSPVGVNTEIIQEGTNGFLASSQEEWIRKLEKLLLDEPLRSRIGLAARQTVEERYSVKVNAPIWIRLIRDSLGDRQEMPGHEKKECLQRV